MARFRFRFTFKILGLLSTRFQCCQAALHRHCLARRQLVNAPGAMAPALEEAAEDLLERLADIGCVPSLSPLPPRLFIYNPYPNNGIRDRNAR